MLEHIQSFVEDDPQQVITYVVWAAVTKAREPKTQFNKSDYT